MLDSRRRAIVRVGRGGRADQVSSIEYLGSVRVTRQLPEEDTGGNGKPFKIFKLRSMIINAEKDGAQFAA